MSPSERTITAWVREGPTQVARSGGRQYRIDYVGGTKPWKLTDAFERTTTHRYIEEAEATAHQIEAELARD